ncbi:MAG: NUDIX domain-containing protein [Phycisphaeraceae bacterium]|nr:NUDIX domain-containing protein [Phycisphaeraceae bacterium]
MACSSIELIVRGVWIHRSRLLVCRNRKHGHCFLPGGHVEFNEPARDALAREIREELGITLTPGPFLGATEAAFNQPRPRKGKDRKKHYDTSDKPPKLRRHHEVNLLFALTCPDTTLDPFTLDSREDHIQFLWAFPLDLLSPTPAVSLLPGGVLPLVAHALGCESTLALTKPENLQVHIDKLFTNTNTSASWGSDWN